MGTLLSIVYSFLRMASIPEILGNSRAGMNHISWNQDRMNNLQGILISIWLYWQWASPSNAHPMALYDI